MQTFLVCLSSVAFLFLCVLTPAAAAPPPSRLLSSPTDNFIASNEYVDCWQSKKMPLRVFVQPCKDVPGFDERYADAFRNACQAWGRATDNRISFVFVDSQDKSDIEVRWTQDMNSWGIHADGHELGSCRQTKNVEEGMVHSAISMLSNRGGKAISPRLMEAMALHELGHAFGLGHSGRKSDVMAPAFDSTWRTVDGVVTIDLTEEAPLSPRDITTMKVVFAAGQHLDAFRQKGLDNNALCYALTAEACKLIAAGDSGQAIIFLQEVLKLDSSYRSAAENLMVAYFNCGAELYNKGHYSEAQPVLARAMGLGKRFGTAADTTAMAAVQRNCLRAAQQVNADPGAANGSGFAVRAVSR